MWSLFFAYQAVTLRVLFLMQRAHVKQGGVNWFDDPGVRQLLSFALSKEEFQRFDGAEYGKLNLLRRFMESQIILSASRLISGEQFGKEAMRQAQEILTVTTQLAHGGPGRKI